MITFEEANRMSFEEMIKNTTFFVEANSYEQMMLWGEWSDDPYAVERYPERNERIKWGQISRGWTETIGRFAGEPVAICLFWNILNGELICFYEATSLIVDHGMVEKWIDDRAPRWGNNRRPATCNAMNFGHCIRAIRDKVNERSKNHTS